MKKRISAILAVLFLITFAVQGINVNRTYAAGKAISIYIDGVKTDLDSEPIIVNSSAFVPLRGLFEKLGADIHWDNDNRQAIIKSGEIEVMLGADNDIALRNGRAVELSAPSRIINSRMMVPVRFVAEALGHKVDWDGKNRRIDISRNKGETRDTGLPVIGSRKIFENLLKYNNLLNEFSTGKIIEERIVDIAPPVQAALDDVKSAPQPEAAPAPMDGAAESGGSGHSSTNVQVEGVDEGDIVKTDGKYIYTLIQNKLHIIDANPNKPEIVGVIETDYSRGSIYEIYVESDKLVILGSGNVNYAYPDGIIQAKGRSFYAPDYYNTSSTFLLVYDVSDIRNPKLIKDMDIEGYYNTSRLIRDKLYFTTSKTFYFARIMPVVGAETGLYNAGEYDADEYSRKPKYADNLTGKITVIDYKDIKYFPDYITPNFMLTVGVDLSTGEHQVSAYLGEVQTVYASAENMYVALTSYRHEKISSLIYSKRLIASTSVYKFALNAGKIEYLAKGSVPGTILNQFSLDEYNGNLRIATTEGDTWDSSSVNNIYVLNPKLEKIGSLTDMAKGEKIYSTRFAGDRIYMVTFKQIDPFFVIDASVPENPKVLGYLKIPGFSTYMHILDKNHILGFGRDTVENQYGNVTTGGFKISLFDVTNPANPIEKDKEVIGDSGTYSQLQYNHKALMIDLNKGLMAFPIDIPVYEKDKNSKSFFGAYVYNITNTSFDLRGKITHLTESPAFGYDFNRYNDTIHRVIYIGDYLYSLSNGSMMVTRIKDMKPVAKLEFKQ